jgi:hypothetical protein
VLNMHQRFFGHGAYYYVCTRDYKLSEWLLPRTLHDRHTLPLLKI